MPVQQNKNLENAYMHAYTENTCACVSQAMIYNTLPNNYSKHPCERVTVFKDISKLQENKGLFLPLIITPRML